MNKLPISAVLITKNEEKNIERVLGSLNFCAEIIVIDSGSTDNTVNLAKTFGAKVTVTEDWPGFGPQKNRALKQASQEWFLSIDADEWVTPELAQAIQSHLTKDTPAKILRRSSFCGKVMRFSGWGDDWVTRLAKVGTAHFSDDLVHERLISNQNVTAIHGTLGHESFIDLNQVLEKISHYSELWAAQSHTKGKRVSIPIIALKTFAAFFKTYILKQGFRDGSHGFLLSFTNAHGTFYKYSKLWLKNREN